MGTRSNTILKDGKTKIVLYRHYDGYPSANGISLANIMTETVAFSKNYESETTSDGTVITTIDDDFRKPIQFFLEESLSHNGIYRIENDVCLDSEFIYEITFLDNQFTFGIMVGSATNQLSTAFLYVGRSPKQLKKKLTEYINNYEETV
jgi:hypothetical protein